MPDQAVRRAVVLKLRQIFAFKFGNDALGEYLAQFDAPLVKRINVPDRALGENAVLIKRDQLAEGLRCKLVGEDDV